MYLKEDICLFNTLDGSLKMDHHFKLGALFIEVRNDRWPYERFLNMDILEFIIQIRI